MVVVVLLTVGGDQLPTIPLVGFGNTGAVLPEQIVAGIAGNVGFLTLLDVCIPVHIPFQIRVNSTHCPGEIGTP